MIKAVFFDIDDTLFTFEKAHAAAMPSLCRYAWEQLGIDPEAFAFAYNDQYRRMAEEIGPQAAIHNRMIRFLRILKENGKPLSFAPVLNDLYWNAVLAAGGPEPGAPECIRSLRQKGYILGVASNMTLDWQMRKLETIGVLPYFHCIVTSEEAGTEKPDKRFFDLCIRYAGCRPEECLMVGDSLELDILGAENAGMHALWYAEPDKLTAHTGFSHYSQLEDRIAALDY